MRALDERVADQPALAYEPAGDGGMDLAGELVERDQRIRRAERHDSGNDRIGGSERLQRCCGGDLIRCLRHRREVRDRSDAQPHVGGVLAVVEDEVDERGIVDERCERAGAGGGVEDEIFAADCVGAGGD